MFISVMYNYCLTMKYLGIDYGSKNIGIALSEEVTNMAFPYKVFRNSKDVLDQILSVIDEEGVGEVVVGESKDYDGEDNAIMFEIRGFVEKLKAGANIPIRLEPEFMSSVQATRIQGINPMIDASAATIILQSFLDKKGKQ